MPSATADNQHVIYLTYGRGMIPLYANPELAEWYVIRPKFAQPLPDAEQQFHAACRHPIGCPPLRDIVRPTDRVVIVTSDGTRPVPNLSLIHI